MPTNKNVGGLFPNDGDGNAWGDKKLGFPQAAGEAGLHAHRPGPLPEPARATSARRSPPSRTADVEIVTGVVIPPDFKTFWTQARQQGFKPKVVSVGKALLFPAAIEASGDLGDGLSTEVWWSPSHPFKSSLTGGSAAHLAEAYEKATPSKQWTQPIGFAHALFEVAADTLKRSKSIDDKARSATRSRRPTSIPSSAPIKWGKGPVKNVAKTPLVVGQWGKGKKYKFELIIVNNQTAKNIPARGTLKLMA